MLLKVKKLREDAVVPTRAYQFDSGLDLYACLDSEFITIKPSCRALVPTGIAIALPPTQLPITYEAQIRPKSGLALKHGLTVLNTPGTVDNPYRNQVQVILYNASSDEIKIEHGQKIAQLVVCPVIIPTIEVVDDLDDTDRGLNGFGSTGLF